MLAFIGLLTCSAFMCVMLIDRLRWYDDVIMCLFVNKNSEARRWICGPWPLRNSILEATPLHCNLTAHLLVKGGRKGQLRGLGCEAASEKRRPGGGFNLLPLNCNNFEREVWLYGCVYVHQA